MNKLLQVILILLLPLLAQADMRGPSDEAKQRADERLAAREQQLDAELEHIVNEVREHLRRIITNETP